MRWLALLLIAGCHAAPGADDVGATDDAGDPPDAGVDVGLDADVDVEPDAAPAAIDPGPAVAELGPRLEAMTGGDVAIAVVDLDSGLAASYRGGDLHVSASSAKAYWVAAALDGAGVAAVEPYAEPIFADSDNFAAGAVIDLVGPDAVNDYLWDVAGLDDTALTSWSFGVTRVASNSPRLLGGNNYTTADDGARFGAALWRGELLGPAETAAILEWMTWSPRSGFGGWAGDGLPEAARASAMHKAGWLPPGCCSQLYNTVIDLGIVVRPGDRAYAYALIFDFGEFSAEEAAMAEASAALYETLAPTP